MTTVRFVLSFSFFLVVVLLSFGCGLVADPGRAGRSEDPLAADSELVVGVSTGHPQIGAEARVGVYEGLDIDVARYLARELGFGRSEVRFVPAPPERRIEQLVEGEVDLVVAAFPITPADKTRIQFAGPYFVARQDIVVRTGTSGIANVRDLHGRPMCAVRGTDAFATIRALGVRPVRRTAENWPDCLLRLKVGDVDAVSAADATIAGYMRYRSRNLRLLGAPFAEERWGVGLRKRDVHTCEQLNRAISRMYADGSALQMQRRWFDGTGLRLNRYVPQFEGCG